MLHDMCSFLEPATMKKAQQGHSATRRAPDFVRSHIRIVKRSKLRMQYTKIPAGLAADRGRSSGDVAKYSRDRTRLRSNFRGGEELSGRAELERGA